MNRKILIPSAIIAFFVAVALLYHFMGLRSVSSGRIRAQKVSSAERARAWDRLKKEIAAETTGFNGTLGIVVKDLDTGWEYSANKDVPMPSASLVKIPVMFAYYSAEREGKVRPTDMIRLGKGQRAQGSGLLKNAVVGDAYSVEDLIRLMITHSDNRAANLLIDRLGIDTLNAYFTRLGLRHTNLVRKMVDFKARAAGIENYTTAGDMAYLMEMLYRGRFIDPVTSKRCLDVLADQKVNDRIPRKLPAETLVAHKTGLERGVCHDVGIVYTEKGTYLICVLTRHGYKSAKVPKALIQRISLNAYNYYSGL